MTSITVSAPGKIHLLGEHAVVYGRPALLAAIDKRLYVEIRSPCLAGRRAKSEIRKNNEIKINSTENAKLVWETIRVFKNFFSQELLPPLEITITSQIPTGSGLGSSAALSAALLGALLKFVKKIWNPAQVNELAYEVEKKAHGHPSGADNSTVVFGGLVWFRREFDFLKSIWSLPVSAYKIPPFVTVDSGKPKESTKEMVVSVAHLYSKKRERLEEIFSDQEKQTKKLLLALKTGNKQKLIVSIKQGEKNLEKLGVVGAFAQKIIKEIENIGGAAKICGAGGRKVGSGIILCYHPEVQKVKNIARKFNLPIAPIKLGEEGIRIEGQK